MLKLILAPDLHRFLSKMNFISKAMAKTSVINVRTGESPVAQCLLRYWKVLLATRGGSSWVVARAPSSALPLCASLRTQLQLEGGSAGWCLDRAQTVLEAKGLDGNLHSSRMQTETHTATQVMVRCNPIALVCEL